MLKINSKKCFFWEGTQSHSYVVGETRTRDLNPRTKPPLALHHTLICIHTQFLFYSYYTTLRLRVNHFWGSQWIQIKNFSTTKFDNFSRSTTSISELSPFEVVYNIWILKLRDSNIVFIDNMITN
jgi:hypothetical protein